MNLSKTTLNFAQKRGLDAYISESVSDGNDFIFYVLYIAEDDDGGEPAVTYIANHDGSFTYKGNIWLSDSVKEELPATIRDEKHLREVIQFLSDELKTAV